MGRNRGAAGSRRSLTVVFSGLVSARLLAAAAQAVMLFGLARLVSPGEFALAVGALGTLTFLSAASDLGVTPATTRAAAAGQSGLVRSLRRLNLRVALAASLFAVVVISVIALLTREVAWTFLLPFGVWIYFERNAEFIFAVDLGMGSISRAVTNLSLRKVIPALTVLIGFIVPGAAPLFLLSSGFALGGLLATVLARSTLKLGWSTADFATSTGATLRASMPFWLNSVGAQARQLDVFLLGAFSTTAGAAAYAPASRLIGPLRLVPTTLAQAALPHVTRQEPGRASPWPLLSLSLALTSGLYGIIFIFAEPVIVVLFGTSYGASVAPLRILLASLVIAGLASVLASYLQATRYEWSVAGISIATAVVSLVLVAGLGHYFGGVGAAAALAIGYTLQFLMTLIVVIRVRRRGQANDLHN